MTIRETLTIVSYSHAELQDLPFDGDKRFVRLENAISLMESHVFFACKEQRIKIAIAENNPEILDIPLVCDEVTK